MVRIYKASVWFNHLTRIPRQCWHSIPHSRCTGPMEGYHKPQQECSLVTIKTFVDCPSLPLYGPSLVTVHKENSKAWYTTSVCGCKKWDIKTKMSYQNCSSSVICAMTISSITQRISKAIQAWHIIPCAMDIKLLKNHIQWGWQNLGNLHHDYTIVIEILTLTWRIISIMDWCNDGVS